MPPRRRRSQTGEGEALAEGTPASPEVVPLETSESAETTLKAATRRRRKRQVEPQSEALEATEPSPESEEIVPEQESATLTRRRRRSKRKAEQLQSDEGSSTRLPVLVEQGERLPAPLSLLQPIVPPPTEVEPPAKPSRRRKKVTPEPHEVTVQPRTTVRLGVRQGSPEIILNGQAVAPLFNFGRADLPGSERITGEQIQKAAEAGIHLHILVLELTVSRQRLEEAVDEARWLVRWLREYDPEGYVMLRILFRPPADWRQLYPEAVTTYADGSTGDPSVAADRYWQEAQEVLAQLVSRLEESQEQAYLLGYHLDYGEWFYDYTRGYDYSPAAQEAFRQWLRGRYRNDVVALRAAWHDGSVTFASASIPPFQSEERALTVLYEARKAQRYVDYLRFASEVMARRIIALSRIVKRCCENRRLVAVSYGYLLELPVAHSGHLSLSEVLSAQSIDLIVVPISYRHRMPAQGGGVPVPVASVRLRGKLCLLEDDTKPHDVQETPDNEFIPRCPDAEATYNVRLRNTMTALIHRAGMVWMDPWGEGWLRDEDTWQQLQPLIAMYRSSWRTRLADPPEVAVIIDERSLTRVQSPQALIEPLLQQQEVLAQAGIHYGIYLQSDLLRKAFPEAKLYLFLNPIQVDSEVRAAIRERLQRDNKTLAWLYAVALYDENGYTPDGPRDVAGIAIKAQPWNSEMGTIISNDRHPISERLRHKQIGVRERINPSFYVLDEGVEVIGEYIHTGLPSIVVKDMGQWRSVFIGERHLTVDLLRGLCRYAGVQVWSQSSDFVQVAPPLLAIHSVGDGTVHLQFPQRSYVYDLLGDRLLAQEVLNMRLGVRLAQSGLYAVGTYEQLSAMGLSLPEPQQARSPHPTEGASSGKKRRKRSGKRHRKRK